MIGNSLLTLEEGGSVAVIGSLMNCINSKYNTHITEGNCYVVLGYTEDSIVIINDFGIEFRYPSTYFKLAEKEMTQYEKDVEEVKQKREDLVKAIRVISASGHKWIFHKDTSISAYPGGSLAVPTSVLSMERGDNISREIYPDPKSPKQSEIERIESEMRKLADDLAKLKG